MSDRIPASDERFERRRPPFWTVWLPLLIFAAFISLVMLGLFRPADRQVASALVGKPMPQYTLPPAVPSHPGLDSAAYTDGQPRLINVFASWCLPCRVEAPQLAALAKAGVRIDGISVRDSAEALKAFLNEHGDPFERIGADDEGRVQLALGSSGVPETYVVDGEGVIRYQHIGEIRPEHLPVLMEKLKVAGK